MTGVLEGSHASSHRHDRLVLVLACTAQFVTVLDVSVVNVALPSMGRELHYGPTSLQWVPNAYVLTFAGFLLLGGRVSDLFGRRRAFLGGLGLFVVASALAGAAPSAVWLTAARGLQGIGSAVLSPATLTIIATTFQGRQLTRAVGVWSAVGSIGGAGGVFLGGLITATLGWRWIFYVNVPICAVAATVALASLAEQRTMAGGRGLDVPGAVTVTAGLALLAYGIVSTDQYAWLSAHTLGCVGGAVVLLGVFLAVQVRSSRPLVPLRLFRSRWVSGVNALVLLLGVWTFTTWYFFSLYLQDAVGYSPLRTGIALVPMTAVLALSAQVSSRIAQPRLGVRRTVQLALSIALCGYVWLSRLEPSGRYWVGLFGAGMVVSFAQGLSWTPLVAAATGAVDRSEAGLASGLLNNSRQVGGSIGLAAIVTIAAARTDQLTHGGVSRAVALTAGYAHGFAVISGVVVAALALSFVLPKRSGQGAAPSGSSAGGG